MPLLRFLFLTLLFTLGARLVRRLVSRGSLSSGGGRRQARGPGPGSRSGDFRRSEEPGSSQGTGRPKGSKGPDVAGSASNGASSQPSNPVAKPKEVIDVNWEEVS